MAPVKERSTRAHGAVAHIYQRGWFSSIDLLQADRPGTRIVEEPDPVAEQHRRKVHVVLSSPRPLRPYGMAWSPRQGNPGKPYHPNLLTPIICGWSDHLR